MLSNKKQLIVLVIILFSLQAAMSQNVVCYSDEAVNKLRQLNPQYDFELRQWENNTRNISQRSRGTVFTIPVVFHVILNTSAKLNSVSDPRIYQQLETLNDDFRLLNADASEIRDVFKSIAADVEIEFCLARQDPNGNQTDGITRTLTSKLNWDYNNEGDDMKFDVTEGHDAWDPNDYLNIWIVDIAPTQTPGGGTVAGYAYRGSSFIHGTSVDGIVLDYQAGFGSTDRSLTHEVGHYLGLRHPWGGGGCSFWDDDGIDDTPMTSGENYGCDTLLNSCSNENPDLPDLIENHMDYTSCRYMFTLDQKSHMRDILIGARFSLTTSPGCQSIVNFTSTEASGCDSMVVSFSDQSLNNPTSWNWNFPGGNPLSSTQPNPTVTYRNYGSFNVTLSVTNNTGTYTATFPNYVEVFENPGTHLLGTNAVCAGVDDGAVQLSPNKGEPPYNYSWSNGTTDQNLTGVAPGAYLVTVTDVNGCSSTNSITIGQDNELEVISVSVPDSSGTGMGTISVSVLNGNFPVSYQWDDPNESTTSAVSGLTAGRYTVTAIDANGCQVVKSFQILDRAPVTAVKEVILFDKLSIYPNPANREVTVEISLPEAEATSLVLYNPVGRLIDESAFQIKNIKHIYDLKGLSPGIYYLKVTTASGSTTKRLVVLH